MDTSWWNDYKSFLKSDKWKITRQRAFYKYGRRCKCCGVSRNLEIHHISYENYKSGNLRHLAVLCSDCHKEVTTITRRGKLKGEYALAQHMKTCKKRKGKS